LICIVVLKRRPNGKKIVKNCSKHTFRNENKEKNAIAFMDLLKFHMCQLNFWDW